MPSHSAFWARGALSSASRREGWEGGLGQQAAEGCAPAPGGQQSLITYVAGPSKVTPPASSNLSCTQFPLLLPPYPDAPCTHPPINALTNEGCCQRNKGGLAHTHCHAAEQQRGEPWC